MKILSLICLTCSLAFAQTTKPIEKPKIITREEWGSTPQPIPDSRKHTPKFITIHHAGTLWTADKDPVKFVKSLQVFGQNQKNWPDVPYHFLIAPDGRIFEGRSIEYEPESNTKYDLQGHIGVELMGNFNEQRASLAQLESLLKLTAYLCQDLKIETAKISSHRDVAKGQTVCPGDDLYRYVKDGLITKWVTQTLEGKEPEVKLLDALPKGPTTMITNTKK
jgi:hypothetical protein